MHGYLLMWKHFQKMTNTSLRAVSETSKWLTVAVLCMLCINVTLNFQRMFFEKKYKISILIRKMIQEIETNISSSLGTEWVTDTVLGVQEVLWLDVFVYDVMSCQLNVDGSFYIMGGKYVRKI